MKRPSIDHQLRACRQLPLEVSFAQVKQWVEEAPERRQKYRKSQWLAIWLRRLFGNEN